MAYDTFHKTVENITASSTKAIGVTQAERQEIQNRAGMHGRVPFNILIAYSTMDVLTFLELDQDSDRRFPLPPNGGKIVINRDDLIEFSTVDLVETEGDNGTGKVFVTYGRTG